MLFATCKLPLADICTYKPSKREHKRKPKVIRWKIWTKPGKIMLIPSPWIDHLVHPPEPALSVQYFKLARETKTRVPHFPPSHLKSICQNPMKPPKTLKILASHEFSQITNHQENWLLTHELKQTVIGFPSFSVLVKSACGKSACSPLERTCRHYEWLSTFYMQSLWVSSLATKFPGNIGCFVQIAKITRRWDAGVC